MRTFIERLKYIKRALKEANTIFDMCNAPSFEINRLLGEIIRNTHSIEKGLSLENVRLGFGYAKIEQACGYIHRYFDLGGNMQSAPLSMFRDAVSAYLAFHDERKFSNENTVKIRSLYDDLNKIIPAANSNFGGILSFDKPNYTDEEYNAFAKIVKDRHSVREFDHTPVDSEKLKRAIELAMRCPSACNRQCYRLYILENKDFGLLQDWIGGTGGFDKELDKLLIITGKTSVYRLNEQYQHVVTSSIFAGYLSLTLQANGIGACVLQRSIFPNSSWDKIKSRMVIPNDELPVCCIGVGNLKETTKAPVSYRLNYDELVTTINNHDK